MTIQNLLFLALLAASLSATMPGQAQDPNRAGLAVQFPDGRVETACVEFSENEITGVDLLNRSGLPVLFDFGAGLGAKVCKIGQTGCDYPERDCWCQCQGSPCSYWNYWQLRDDNWVYSPLGASMRQLGDGDVDSWVWGNGQQPPPLLSLDEICRVEVEPFTSPLDTPTTQPIATQQPPPTATSPASPLAEPTVTAALPLTATARPPASPTSTPAVKVFVPAMSGETRGPESPEVDLPVLSDRYVGFAGVLAALGLIALTVWRRRKGV